MVGKMSLLLTSILVSLFVSGCAMTKEEAAQATAVALASHVEQAVATLVRAGTPLPTHTPIPPTPTPRPTSTATPTPTATPFTGWVRYESATGKELGRLPKGVSPPNDVVGDPGATYVHFTNGREDGDPVETPAWWPLVLGGIPVLLLLALGIFGALLWFGYSVRKEERRYQENRQLLLGTGGGQEVVSVLLTTLQVVSPRAYYQVQERLTQLSKGGEGES
jgi:hypothetical protein